MNAALKEAERKLVALVCVTPNDILDRLKLYSLRATGGRILSEYLPDESVPLEDRAAIVRALTDILETKQYDRLPELPVPVAVTFDKAGIKATTEAGEVFREPTDFDDPHLSTEDRSHLPDDARIRRIVREELSAVMATIAKVLKE